jgi:spermidine synthase
LFASDRFVHSGLGTGISASAFVRHNISTTIVELDPAVYAAARKYFGLPDPGPAKIFLEDARAWVTQKRSNIAAADPEGKPELYDIVVHDCFSGGGVPKHIFTVEFWEDLKMIMNPEGVLAVVSLLHRYFLHVPIQSDTELIAFRIIYQNFAGHANSNASHAILHTLRETFGECRVFHDALQEFTEEQYQNEFINMACYPS